MSARAIIVDVLDLAPCRILLSWLARLPHGIGILNKLSHYRGVFANLEEARWVAARRTYATHNHPKFIELEFELSRRLRASDYAALYWLLRIAAKQHDLKVFDFGGNAGNLYYIYSEYLKDVVQNLAWTVFDLPVLVEEGCRIAAERKAKDLRFINRIPDPFDANVLLVSAALHYWETSIGCFMHQFNTPPEHVILNRTHVHEDQPSFITVQRTGAYAVPCIVRNASELVSSFVAAGYVLVDQWLAPEQGLRMPLFPALTARHSYGFCFRRKNLPTWG